VKCYAFAAGEVISSFRRKGRKQKAEKIKQKARQIVPYKDY
jgi:hypothetical protein